MHKALNMLKITPEHIIIDGNRFKPFKNIMHTTIIKGDAKYLSIAAASILAKTYRDDYMIEIDKQFPMYNWKKNKGYPTKEHRLAIKEFGITPHHRKSFRLLNDQLKFDF
jgi:ribonuclease HII